MEASSKTQSRRLSRPPNDIDIVTFAERPTAVTDFNSFVNQNRSLFSPASTKTRFSTDAYFVDLGLPPTDIVDLVCYWCGLFSHRRSSLEWKGMIQVDLFSDDTVARNILDEPGGRDAS
jgi:hypothetical protein